MDWSRHTVMKYISDEKTHTAINSILFRNLDHINNAIYQVEIAKKQIDHKEPTIVGIFILQYAKLRVLELNYNFLTKVCAVNESESLENDTDSLYLALAEKEPGDCKRTETKATWERLRSKDCNDSLTADSDGIFSPNLR